MSNEHAAPLLVLLGFMGAGKTTLIHLLSKHLGCPLVDLDDAIVAHHGPIPELFRQHGEPGFRQIEHQQLEQTLAELPRPAVLALGGGAFLQAENRALLERYQAVTIFLDVPFEVAMERIRDTGAERPLAADLSRLRDLYEARCPIYLQAQHRIDAGTSDPEHLLTELVRLAVRLGVVAATRDTL